MLIVRHERFLQARSQRCFQLFLDDDVKYCARERKNGVRESFVENLDFTQLQEHENKELEDEISIDEVRNALKGFQNNKSPGDDGFTKEFYEAFFDLLGNALTRNYLIDPKR